MLCSIEKIQTKEDVKVRQTSRHKLSDMQALVL